MLQPILVLIKESTLEEYEEIILPVFRGLFSAPKTVQATVTILENLHVILQKTSREDIRAEILTFLFNSFESTTIQVQVRITPSPCFFVVTFCRALFYLLFIPRLTRWTAY